MKKLSIILASFLLVAIVLFLLGEFLTKNPQGFNL